MLNTQDNEGDVWDFTEGVGLTVPSLLAAGDLYEQYSRSATGEGEEPWAPYPLQVIVDQDGIIRYMAQQYDATAVQRSIDGMLEGR